MSRFIIHIGTHKTGTTTIQRTLAGRRGKLLKRGLWYPNYESIGRMAHYAHIGAANGLAGDHASIGPDLAAKFFQQTAAQAGAHAVTLLSAESLYRQVISAVPPQKLDTEAYWASRHAYIARLRELTGDAEIVVVFRRQADFAESLYQEHVKVTRYGGDFESFRAEFWFHFRYLEQYRAWRAHFTKVHLLRFDDLAHVNITQRFLTALNVRGGRLPVGEARNVGLDPDWVIYKRWLNETGLDRAQLLSLLDVMSDVPMTTSDRKRRLFRDAAARGDFQAGFETANRELLAEAGLTLPRLFEEIGSDDAEYGDTLDLARRGRLTAHLLERLLASAAAEPRETPASDPV